MNERIKELAKKADPEYTGIYDDDMGHAIVGNKAIEKFAELIVRECAAVGFEAVSNGDSVEDSILAHFGVEE